MLLKNACEAEENDAAVLIKVAELQLPQDSLTTAIDSAGVYYRVPICCIQDPDNYEVDTAMDAMKAKKAPKEKNITVSFMTVYTLAEVCFSIGKMVTALPYLNLNPYVFELASNRTFYGVDQGAKRCTWRQECCHFKLQHY